MKSPGSGVQGDEEAPCLVFVFTLHNITIKNKKEQAPEKIGACFEQ